ncbi:MAG: alkaline phosphatase family protein [Acidobacteria bacterium]|nr:alkaline phosphatase family protein [Acidobacteriota bacterium]
MRLASALLFTLPTFLAAQTPRPKLLVAITIDQFRYDYLIKFRDQYKGGLARLLDQGAVFTNAYYEHFPTVTAIGHSTLLTGATPSISGIVGNEWYERETGKQVTSVSDEGVTMLGGAGRGGRAASPRRLLVSTIGDELKMAGRGSKVIGISVKDRSAILPVGRMADAAYWFDPSSGNFVSSTYYFEQLPAWVHDFNQSRFADKFVGSEWRPIGGGAPFKTMSNKPDNAYYNSLESTPYGNDLVEKLAEAAITGEQLGKRNSTDVLAVSFSANDYVGHAVGPDAPEVRDISIRTDRLVGDFFRFLDARVGMKNVLVVMTADHGVSPMPEVNLKRKMPGGRMLEKTVADQIQMKLTEKYGEGNWVVGKSGASQYLNEKLIAEKKLNRLEVLEAAAEAIRALPNIFRVYTREQLRRGAVQGDMVDRRVLNGFHYARAMDVAVVAEPYHVFVASGTSHGLPFQYDAHIPVIFLGEGVQPGRYHKRIAANDIAPTLATMLEVEVPSGAVGRVLDEMLAEDKPAATGSRPKAAASSRP